MGGVLAALGTAVAACNVHLTAGCDAGSAKHTAVCMLSICMVRNTTAVANLVVAATVCNISSTTWSLVVAAYLGIGKC